MSGRIEGPRSHIYVDSDVVPRITAILWAEPHTGVLQRAALLEVLAGHEQQRWTLVTGDTILKEVRKAPQATSVRKDLQLAALEGLPYHLSR